MQCRDQGLKINLDLEYTKDSRNTSENRVENGPQIPDVSIIIPNLNSMIIDRTLASLFTQTSFARVLEILVIGLDNPQLVKERFPVRFISTVTPVTAPVARNIGICEASGDYYAFIDADCVADPHWLEMLLLAQCRGHSIVGGSVALDTGNYWQQCYNLTMFHEFLTSKAPGERRNFGTLNLCVSRDVVERTGLFDESLARGQDTEWTLRMRRCGYQLYFTPDAIIQHYPDQPSVRKIWSVWYRSGNFNARIRNEYKDLIPAPPFHKFPLLLVIFAPWIAFVVAALIFMRDPCLLRYIHTFPVIYLSKIAWCLGASRHDGF